MPAVYRSSIRYLIPLNITLSLTSLIPLQVTQDTCRSPNRKIIIAITAERRNTGRHIETMQITCNRARSLSDLLCLEIISGIECKRPIIGNFQVTRHVDILRILKRITHRITIDRLTAILGNTERIVHIQRPWHLKYLITVTIRLCFFYPLLSNRFVTGRISFFFVDTVLFLLLIVILIFPEQLLPGIIIECIVDGRSHPWKRPKRP